MIDIFFYLCYYEAFRGIPMSSKENINILLQKLKLKADFESSNREARAYKILLATFSAYNEPSFNSLAKIYKEIALSKAISYAEFAINKEIL